MIVEPVRKVNAQPAELRTQVLDLVVGGQRTQVGVQPSQQWHPPGPNGVDLRGNLPGPLGGLVAHRRHGGPRH